MKASYLSPEAESIPFQIEALICQSATGQAQGGIDPVSELNLDDEVWTTFQ